MGRTMRDVLVHTLENLDGTAFKKFKNKLNDLEIYGYSRIPRCRLVDADREDVADLIISYYTDDDGIEVTLMVLKAINENKDALNLSNALKTVNGRAPPESPMGANPGSISGGERDHGGFSGCVRPSPNGPIVETTPLRGEEHFVDRHCEALIRRVTEVDLVLADLYKSGLLSGEDHDRLRRMTPRYVQMQELFYHAASWGPDGKDQFWNSLRHHNYPLLWSLERS